MCWAFLELANNPEWQEKIREEILSSGGQLEYNDLENLKYLNAHLKVILFHWFRKDIC